MDEGGFIVDYIMPAGSSLEETNRVITHLEKILAATPMGKFGSPDDLQGAALFLLSDLSAFMTGVVIPIDGGFNAYSGV